MKIKLLLSAVTCALTLGMCSQVRAQQPTTQERVLALKASLAASKALLKQYQWVETTVVTLKGEEKSRKQQHSRDVQDPQILHRQGHGESQRVVFRQQRRPRLTNCSRW